MIHLLARWFIREPGEGDPARVRTAYGVLASCVGIVLNVMLCALKLFAGTAAGSVAIRADAMNNLSDAGSSVVTLLGFRLSEQKPDPGHPFGHGRIEYISGLVVAFLIIHMSLDLLHESIDKLRNPELVTFSWVTAAILAVSVLTKLYMFAYNRSIGKRLGSSAMEAAAQDSISDTAATAVVLVSGIVGRLTGLNIDAWCGIAVALFILYSGIMAARDTVSPLLGQPPEAELVEQIRRIVLGHGEIQGLHDLIVHDYGPGRRMISLHAEVPEHADLRATHEVIDTVEQELREQLGCEAVVHMDPIVTDDAETAQAFMTVARIVTAEDERLSLHDFRMVKGPTRSNLIFDMVVPYGFHMKDEELVKEICDRVRSCNPSWNAVINIDKSYV